MPELDEHDLAHLDAYTAAARLIVDGRQTPAFTLRTRPPKPVIGDAAVIRRITAAAVPAQDTNAIDGLVERLSRRGRHGAPRPADPEDRASAAMRPGRSS